MSTVVTYNIVILKGSSFNLLINNRDNKKYYLVSKLKKLSSETFKGK